MYVNVNVTQCPAECFKLSGEMYDLSAQMVEKQLTSKMVGKSNEETLDAQERCPDTSEHTSVRGHRNSEDVQAEVDRDTHDDCEKQCSAQPENVKNEKSCSTSNQNATGSTKTDHRKSTKNWDDLQVGKMRCKYF